MYDIPFIRFAFPLLILYLFWWGFVENPYQEEEIAPGALSSAQIQRLLQESTTLMAAQKPEQALVPLLTLYKAYPESPIYIKQIAEIYQGLNRYQESAAMWENFLTYSPRPTEGCPAIGLAYENASKPKDAFKAFERCWQLDKQDPDSIFFYGHELEKDQQLQAAYGQYKHGVQLSPEYPDMQVGLARIELRLGHLSEAHARLLKVLERRPENVDALLAAGLVSAATGDPRAAIVYLEKAQRLSPGYTEVGQVLARARQGAR
ncbi:MAG TPA: tetratricopeptide repeat protein [Bryobacteraceae bacterium]|nr:tetratricopeptide repeat protein [Bryobacteraceae bacterium]